MCSTCGSDIYGQEQADARRKDAEKLKKVRAKMEAKAKTPKN